MGVSGMQAIEEFLTTWAAAEQAGNTTTLETLLASDFTAVGPLGFILTKQAWLARHRHGDRAQRHPRQLPGPRHPRSRPRDSHPGRRRRQLEAVRHPHELHRRH